MRIILLFTIMSLLACSSVEKREAVQANHERNKNIQTIDDMIVKDKKEYIEKCYMPVIKKVLSDAPRPCETSLSQLMERRYPTNYLQEHLDAAADELFFADMRERITKKMKSDAALRKSVGRKFGNMDEVMVYYKSKYSFRNK